MKKILKQIDNLIRKLIELSILLLTILVISEYIYPINIQQFIIGFIVTIAVISMLKKI